VLLKGKNIHFESIYSLEEFLLNTGYDVAFGARPLKRTIQRYFDKSVSNRITDE